MTAWHVAAQQCNPGAAWVPVHTFISSVCHQSNKKWHAHVAAQQPHCICCSRAINHSNSSGTYSQAPKHRRKAPPRTLLHSCLALLSCALHSFQALKAVARPLFLILLAMALQALLRWWNCSQDSQAVATAWFCSLATMRSWMLPAALTCT